LSIAFSIAFPSGLSIALSIAYLITPSITFVAAFPIAQLAHDAPAAIAWR
jgi:hypothetical protein